MEPGGAVKTDVEGPPPHPLTRHCGALPGSGVLPGVGSSGWVQLGFSTYDERVKQIPCVCGYAVKGEDDDELWQNAQEHLREDHPDLVGKISRTDLLAQAEEVPTSTP
jgi:predicted small metal-binding protein